MPARVTVTVTVTGIGIGIGIGLQNQCESYSLHDTDATRRWEALVAQAQPPHTLVQRAGLTVTRGALAVAPHAQRVYVVCGPRNNGGDGLLGRAHRHRADKSVEVTVLLSQKPAADAAAALQAALAAGASRPVLRRWLRDRSANWRLTPSSASASSGHHRAKHAPPSTRYTPAARRSWPSTYLRGSMPTPACRWTRKLPSVPVGRSAC